MAATMTSKQDIPQWLQAQIHPTVRKTTTNMIDPPGYAHAASSGPSKQNTSSTLTDRQNDQLKVKKAWEAAFAPAKALPMNVIMAYFSGSSLQIFSIIMTFMLFTGPIKGILKTNSILSRFETPTNNSQIVLAKLAYIASQLLMIGVGIYKVNSMGLLPNKQSDWLAWESIPTASQTAIYVP